MNVSNIFKPADAFCKDTDAADTSAALTLDLLKQTDEMIKEVARTFGDKINNRQVETELKSHRASDTENLLSSFDAPFSRKAE